MLLGNRVYHLYTGRFLTRDPAGAGDNDYEYANNNPLSYTDPLGLDPPGAGDLATGAAGRPGSQQPETLTDYIDYYLNKWVDGKCVSSTYLFTVQTVTTSALTYAELFPTQLGVKYARKPGKTPPSSWPPPPPNVVGKKPNWNSEGFWEGKNNVTWDSRSHGTGQRGNDGHWDQDMGGGGSQGSRWDREGNLLSAPYNPWDLSQYDWTFSGSFTSNGAYGAFGTASELSLAP